jgi:hypothetical protein
MAGSTPAGRRDRASCKRSLTSWRAKYRSVPSLNTTVTWDRPYFDSERVPSSRGKPFITLSIGKLMRCSTSSGEMPGAAVLICTWTLVMSGTASIGSRP